MSAKNEKNLNSFAMQDESRKNQLWKGDESFALGMMFSSVCLEQDVDQVGDRTCLSVMEPANLKAEAAQRGSWSNQVEFFLSCMAYAVGIGNVWRFPYKCYKNGGGVFLIPYLAMLLLAALPMFYMELALGQFSQLGPNKVFGKLAPVARGLGYGMLCVTMWVAVYYNVIIAWAFFYTFASLNSSLAWAHCDNWFNTADCYSPDLAASCGPDQLWHNASCLPTSLLCRDLDTAACQAAQDAVAGARVSPAEEYFKRYMLLMEPDSSLDQLGGLNWRLVGCLFISWLVVLACLIKGVKSAGKVVWFTALFPYLVLVLLLARGASLPGAAAGVQFYIYPAWDKLLSVHVWADAATQIFYSLGPAFGGLITLSSYNRRDNNCQRDAVLIAAINSGTSVFAGFVIFSILGFMADQLGVGVGEVVEGGTGLAFVVYPTALARLPAAPLWSALFFTMLLTLGLDSQFTMVESLITALYDEWPGLRSHQVVVVPLVCLVGFLLGLPICLQGGFYLFVLLDWYSGSWSLLLLAVLEVLLVGWVYGAARLRTDIQAMGIRAGRALSWYWDLTWRLTTPLLLSCVLLATLADYQPAREGDYLFPHWANILGWAIALSSVLATLPLSCIECWRALRSGRPLSHLLQPCLVHREAAAVLATSAAISRARLGDEEKHCNDNAESSS